MIILSKQLDIIQILLDLGLFDAKYAHLLIKRFDNNQE